MKLSPARRNDAIMAAVILAVIVVDQLTKHWIVQYFRAPYLRPPIAIVGPFLQLEYVQNSGVAFSLLEGQSVLFIFITLAVVVIGALYWRLRDTANLVLKVTFGLILGGAIGNLIDRARHAYVVDFIHFQIPGHFDFAVFNAADSAISVGVVALAFLLWRGMPQDAGSRPTGAPGAPERSTPPPGPDRPAAGRSAAADGRPSTVPRVRNPRPRAR